MRARRVRKALAIVRDWPVALEAVALAMAVRCALCGSTLRRPASLVERWRRLRLPAAAISPERAATLVAVVIGRLARQTCLTQAFVLSALLQRRGIDAVVCIGTRRDGDGLAAHAWLRCGDRLLLEHGHGAYAPLCIVGSEIRP